MQLKPIFDVGWALGVMFFGVYTMMVGIPLTIVVESIMIRQIFFKAEKFWTPVGITLGINLVSGAIGALIINPLFLGQVDTLSIALTGMPTEYYEIAPQVLTTLALIIFLGTLILSIVIEGVMLTLIFKAAFSTTTIWLTAVGINIISYFGFFLLGLSLIQFEWSIVIMIAVACIYALCIYLLFSRGLNEGKKRV